MRSAGRSVEIVSGVSSITFIMIRSIFFAVLAVITLSVRAGDVLVATSDNFEDIISKDDLTLVKFFAPWCGHCKKMANDFEEAATELKGKAQLVDLDATQEKDLATKYGIRGFPTLKLFSKGEVISDYKGGRTKDAFVKYIERALLPSVEECADADAVSKFVKDNEGKSIVFGAALDKLAAEFKKASMSLRDSMPDSIVFGSVTDVALLKDLASADVAADSILILRDDKSTDTYTGEPEGLEEWIKLSALPIFGELSRETAGIYTDIDKPVFIFFQDPDKKDETAYNTVLDVAKESRGQGFVFTWINNVELKSFAEHLGVADKSPAIAIYDFKSDTKYIYSEDLTKDNLSTWVSKVSKGEVNPTMKSEPVPEKNDEPVKVVVGDTWADIVEDESKDVLIEQYAPWCGHCKKLAPILDELAKKLEGVETLVIAKMDATQNDAPKDYKARGYPSLHFFAAGSKKGVSYDGGRTLEDFVKFLQENATNKDGIELPAEEASDSTEDTKEEEKKETKEGEEEEKEDL